MLDIFGQNALPLLLAGSLGGLCRGIVVRDGLIDVVRAVIVGACCSLFAHQFALMLLGGWLDNLNLDPGSEVGFSGFVAGITGITIITAIIDFVAKRKPPEPPEPPTPPQQPIAGVQP